EQGIVVLARSVPLHQHLALKCTAFHRISTGIVEIGVAADDLAVVKDNFDAALPIRPSIRPTWMEYCRASGSKGPLQCAISRVNASAPIPRSSVQSTRSRQRIGSWPAKCMAVSAP